MSKTLENSTIPIKRETALIQWKELALLEQQDFEFPQNAKIISVEFGEMIYMDDTTKSEQIQVYYTTNPVNDNKNKTLRFFLHRTSHELADRTKKFIKTFSFHKRELVLHFFANRLC